MGATASALISEGSETGEEEKLMEKKVLGIGPDLDHILQYPEILERIFEQMDVRHLKVVRQVCKLWNAEACRVLRNKCSVTCDSHHDVNLFCKVLSGSSSEETRALPSPFKFLSLVNIYDVQEGLQALVTVSKEKMLVWNLQFPFASYELSQEAHALLKSIADIKQFPHLGLTLTHLTINGPDCNRVEICDFELPVLRRLTINHYCPKLPSLSPNCACIRFNSNIIRGAPNLKSLSFTLGGSIESSIYAVGRLLKSCGSKDLEELRIMDNNLYVNPATSLLLLKALNTGKFSLRHLSLKFWLAYQIQNEEQNQALLELVKKHSASLRHLNLMEVDGISHQLFSKEFPQCPNLEILALPEYHLGSDILGKAPALRTLQVTHLVCDLALDYQNAPSFPSVTNLGFKSIKGAKYMDPVAKKALLVVLKQFPNATAWDMSLGNVIDFCELLKSGEIFHSRIQRLGIWTCIGNNERHLEFLTNMSSSERQESWRLIPAYFGRYRGPSIQDLKGLKQLIFHHRDGLVEPVFEHCLSQMKDLETVQFPWVIKKPLNPKDFSTRKEMVTKHLRHLRQILISDCCHHSYRSVPAVDQVFAENAAVSCGCKDAKFYQAMMP